MKELSFAKNTITDLDGKLRNEDMSKARGELSEIGQLIRNHNSRRCEHQANLRQTMEQLENQIKYFASLEDMKAGDEKWNWFHEKINKYERDLMEANTHIQQLLTTESVQSRTIADMSTVKSENDSLSLENRRLKDGHERLSNTNVVLKSDNEHKVRVITDGEGRIRNLSNQLDDMRSYQASPLKTRYDSPNRSRLQD